jgi:sugar phosphate isomerase/epimerase
MQLRVYKALWGMSGDLESQLVRIKEANYDGVEGGIPAPEDAGLFARLKKELSLGYVAAVFTSGPDHLASFNSQLEAAQRFEPDLISSQSAEDSMTFAEQRRFFEGALEAERESGMIVAHETHRQRAMFTPWATAALCREFPELKLTADYSHWVCVCERFLDDQQEQIRIANCSAIHVHGRIGFPEGPQVNDPRTPENKEALLRHEEWWAEIVTERKKAGAKSFTFNPEFGPPGYMHTLPFTEQPVADLWEFCLWMAERFRTRFPEMMASR